MKTCLTCQIVKPVEEFPLIHYKGQPKYRASCKACINAYKRQWRRTKEGENERDRDRLRAWTARNREQILVRAAKKRAKARGLSFEISAADVIVPELCPVLGIPLIWGIGKVSNNSPSIDRLDSSLGYTKDNIRVISHRANGLKSDLTISQVRALLRYMECP